MSDDSGINGNFLSLITVEKTETPKELECMDPYISAYLTTEINAE